MAEWTSPYNPFNSMKALVHAERFESILEGKPKAPLVVNMDLTNACNYKCGFCMFGGLERESEGSDFREGNAKLPEGYATTLPKFWKEWGVRAVCLAGGGEPSLHPDCLEFIANCGTEGLDLGFVTNGYLVNNQDWWKTINDSCKFVGFSVDAGTREDYQKVKGVPGRQMDTVLENMRGIRSQGDVQIGYKFVLDRNNWEHIYDAAEIARDNGATHFQFRPAIDPDPEYFSDKIDNIKDQISRAQKDFETEDYKVMGVMHKFNSNLTKKHDFSKCRANMLTSTWCADGEVYMCTDTRGDKWSHLTNHFPDPQKVVDYWGSKEHLAKVEKIDSKNCDRCTLAPYNEMFEQVFINDKMDRNLI